jgi:hypothetical protein
MNGEIALVIKQNIKKGHPNRIVVLYIMREAHRSSLRTPGFQIAGSRGDDLWDTVRAVSCRLCSSAEGHVESASPAASARLGCLWRWLGGETGILLTASALGATW